MTVGDGSATSASAMKATRGVIWSIEGRGPDAFRPSRRLIHKVKLGRSSVAARIGNGAAELPLWAGASRTPMDTSKLSPAAFRSPAIQVSGAVDYAMYARFREQLDRAPDSGLVVVELSTLGGDPEVARMMGEDIRFHSDLEPQRRLVFLGKAAIYSAGTTFMSFFARENRYLTRGTRLMIHERRLVKTLQINGPLTTCVADVEATLNEIKGSIEIQNEGFENLIRGSQVSLEELLRRAPANWYIEAQAAKHLGLVQEVI